MSARRTRALFAAVAAALSLPLSASRAEAVVVHEQGFSAVVAGFRSWYGGYGLAGIGTSWCVDHGPPAPDAALDYGPAELGERSPATRQAIAWALGAHGPGADRVTAAALELVLHDLMGAHYPTGTLDVGRLAAGDLAGFDGQEAQVLDRARAIKGDAVAHASLRGPLTLDARAEPVPPGQPGALVVRLHDAGGTGVAGVAVHAAATGARLTGGADAATGPDGGQTFPFTAVAGENRFEVAGTVPDLALQSFAPRRARAQRVARPARAPVTAVTGFTAVPPRRLTLRKSGDAAAYLSLAGARFAVSAGEGGPPVATLVTDATGAAGAIELPAGRYLVRESEPPAGYAPAGPWWVDLTQGDGRLDVADRAWPGRLELAKLDAATGRPLGGAQLQLDYDADHDGAFETHLAAFTTTVAATVREGLVPGDYQVTETAAPSGYERLAAPVRFHVAPGRTAAVQVVDAPLPEAPPRPPPPPPPPAPAPARPSPALPSPALPALSRTGSALAEQVAVGAALVAGGGVLTAAGRGRGRRRRAEAAPGSR